MKPGTKRCSPRAVVGRCTGRKVYTEEPVQQTERGGVVGRGEQKRKVTNGCGLTRPELLCFHLRAARMRCGASFHPCLRKKFVNV